MNDDEVSKRARQRKRQEAIGGRIRLAREERNWSQEDLGKMYGCSGPAISQIERGRRGIGIPDLERLAGILGKPIGWLLAGRQVDNTPVRRSLGIIIKELQRVYQELETVEIPVRGSVPAGGVAELEEDALPEHVQVPRNLLARARKAYGLKFSGHLMEQDGIEDSDFIIVDPDFDFASEKLYLVRLGNELAVQRLSVDKVQEQTQILGRVIASGHWRSHV